MEWILMETMANSRAAIVNKVVQCKSGLWGKDVAAYQNMIVKYKKILLKIVIIFTWRLMVPTAIKWSISIIEASNPHMMLTTKWILLFIDEVST